MTVSLDWFSKNTRPSSMREAGAMPQWLVGARPGTLDKAGIGAPPARSRELSGVWFHFSFRQQALDIVTLAAEGTSVVSCTLVVLRQC